MEELRKEISRIDVEIIELIAERKEIAEEIGEIKKESGLEIKDKDRELTVKTDFLLNGLHEEMPSDCLIEIIENIIEICKRVQYEQ